MKKCLTPEEFVKLARQVAPDERVPYAFEKCVMANLSAVSSPDPLVQWTRALWRAVAPCFAIMLVVAAVSFSQASPPPADLELDLEAAVLTPPEPTLDFEP